MPIIFEKQIDAAKKLAVWHITEQLVELSALCAYLPHPQLSIKRNTEIAVSRLLLQFLLQSDKSIAFSKDENGKPFLANSNTAISFTHSKAMVACIINLDARNVGIDIEIIRDKIKLIAPKFVTQNDVTPFVETYHSHLIWGAKEVLYKIYALKGLDFKDHLKVNITLNNGYGEINKNEYFSKHNIEYLILHDYMLVWGW